MNLLGALALFSSGCILDIDGSDFGDEDGPHGPGGPHPSYCEVERNQCLMEAAGNPMFQDTCQDAYLECLGIDSDDDSSFESDECPEEDSEDEDECPSEEPSSNSETPAPKDTVWQERCSRIEMACKDACDDEAKQASCEQWGQQCQRTRCGDQLCSTITVSPQLRECGKGHLGCLEGASTEQESQLCSGSFRVCAKAIPGLEGAGQTSDAELSQCLDTHARCQRAASSDELQQTCMTMLRACLQPW